MKFVRIRCIYHSNIIVATVLYFKVVSDRLRQKRFPNLYYKNRERFLY